MQLKESQIIAIKIIEDLLRETQRNVKFNQLINTKLSIYCYHQSFKYADTVYEQNYRKCETREDCVLEKQPNALIQDNFFPTAAAIDQPEKPKPVKNSIDTKQKKIIARNNTQHSLSQVSLNKKVSKQQPPVQYEKLDLPQPEEQQAILKQLRKQVEEQSNKLAQSNAKLKQQKPKKKEGKQQKIGFNYDGQVIRLKSQNKNSLVSGGLNGQTLKTIQKLKEANKKIQHTQIDYERKDKKFAKVARNTDIQFTDIKALLSEVRVSKGIKMSQDGRVIQQRKKTLPVKELMKTLTARKLSKDDYRRIKQTTGNVSPFDDYSNPSKTMNTVISESKNQGQQQNLQQFRSASQSKFSNTLTQRKSTITISDALLLQNLISGAQNQATYRTSISIQQPQKQEKIYQKFDSNDYYNLQYMKKKGSMQIKKNKSTTDLTGIKLPRIQQNKQEMPRIRQKLKDKQQIVRAIRRKFQQKLRT